MPPPGSRSWMLTYMDGKKYRRKQFKVSVAKQFVRNSARRAMVTKKRESDTPEAIAVNRKRDTRNQAEKIVASQLKCRLKSKVSFIMSDAVRSRRYLKNLRFPTLGQTVFFLSESGRVAQGQVLCFADRERQFVGLDRSPYMKNGNNLSNIEVRGIGELYSY